MKKCSRCKNAAVKDRSMCAYHLEYNARLVREHMKKNPGLATEMTRARRILLESRGLCVHCGKVPPKEGRVTCGCNSGRRKGV